MTRKTLTAAAVIAALAAPLAAPAIAAPVSQGATQLAESIGVAPGVYSLSQLSELASVLSDDSSSARQRAAFILANPQGPGVTDVSFVSRSANNLQGDFPDAFLTSEPTRLAN